jgi:hypothetical protein
MSSVRMSADVGCKTMQAKRHAIQSGLALQAVASTAVSLDVLYYTCRGSPLSVSDHMLMHIAVEESLQLC